MWPAVGRSALAASRSPPGPTTSPPSARPARRTCSRPWPTPPPCSTPFSREPPLGLAGGRARSQGAGRRPRRAASRAGARRGDARFSWRHDRPTVRSRPHTPGARRSPAAARVSPGRRHAGLRGAGVEGSPLAARGVPPPRRSGGARCGPRLGGDDPRAAGVRGVAAHRPSGGGVSARPGRAAPRVVSGDGRVARGRRRAVRDRARDRRLGPRPGPVSSRVAAVLRRPVRGPHGPGRPPRPMSAQVKIPMPLRVPELAPSLGRVLVPRRLEEPWVPLDDIREELATRVMELGGEARAAAAGEDRDRVLDAVSRRAWLAAWEAAVRRTGEPVTAALDQEIERAARRVRMPRRPRRRRLLRGPEKRAIAARLAAGGETLVAALDVLDAVAARVREASVLDKGAHADWQEALRTAARRLEAPWLALEAQVADEQRRWTDEIDAVARWRPSLWPLVALWTPLAVALVWLGLVLGGHLPAPAWLAARLGF